MWHYPEIPLTLIRDLLCRHCTKFVSCGPVYVVPDGSLLCGRCYMLAKPIYRNYIYETIAKCFVYPCCYWMKYCTKTLYWNECFEHERNCVYNTTIRLLCTHPTVLFRAQRTIPNITEKPLEHIREDVLDQLKCVNCDCYLSCDPVYICNDGKNICHRCTTSNGVPRYCIRNLSYERLANFIIFPCIYRYRGCTIRLKYGRDLWQHETECSYGQINKKPTTIKRLNSKNGKERGVIQTHSGHVYGTLTPHSALFVPPPKNHNNHNFNDAEFITIISKKSNDDNGNKQFDDTQSLKSNSTINNDVQQESRSSLLNGFNLHLYHYPPFYMDEYNRKKLKHTQLRSDNDNQELDGLITKQLQRINDNIYGNCNNLDDILEAHDKIVQI